MSRPLSLKQFKDNLYLFARLMREGNLYMDVAHGNRLVRFSVEDLGKLPPWKKRKKSYIDDKTIQAGKCPTCRRLTVNGVCFNPKCPQSSG